MPFSPTSEGVFGDGGLGSQTRIRTPHHPRNAHTFTYAYTALHTLLHTRMAPLGWETQLKGHCTSTLTNEPAPLGMGARPRSRCPATLRNDLPHWAGGHTRRAIVLPQFHSHKRTCPIWQGGTSKGPLPFHSQKQICPIG